MYILILLTSYYIMGISYFLYIKYNKETSKKNYDFFTNNGFIINRDINDMFFNSNIEENTIMESNIDEDEDENNNNINDSDDNLLVDI